MSNALARMLFLERADVCNCDKHNRRRLIDDGSVSGNSIKSHYNSLKKGGFGEISEHSAEDADDIHGLVDRPLGHRHRHHQHGRVNALGQHMPCRRTCSTVHHPMFHAWGKGGRPKSAGQKQKDIAKIDWHTNEIAQILDMGKVTD